MNGVADPLIQAGDLRVSWDKKYLVSELVADEFTYDFGAVAGGGFPQRAGTPGVLQEVANTTTHPVPYPTDVPGGIQAGDLLILVFGIDSVDTITNWGSFTELAQSDVATATAHGGVAYKIAVGGETGTNTVTTGGTGERGTALMQCIQDWDGVTPPAISTAATGNSADPDPGPVTAPWGAANNLAIACMVNDTTVSLVPTAPPPNYTNLATASSASAATSAMAFHEVTGGTENPGAFTMTTEQWVAWTVIVKPGAGGPAQLTGNLGLQTETDTPQPITARKQLTLGLLTETDSVSTLGERKSQAIGLQSEVDTAQVLGSRKQLTLGQVTETDTVQPITAQLLGGDIVLGLQIENDTAQPLTSRKLKGISQLVETDTPQPITTRRQRALGFISESVTLFSITARKQKVLGQVVELDTPFTLHPLSPTRVTLGLVTELDTFPPEPAGITRRKRKTIGLITEADTLQPVVVRSQRVLGLVTEVDSAQALTVKKRMVITLSLLQENDQALALFAVRGELLTPQPRYNVTKRGASIRRTAGR